MNLFPSKLLALANNGRLQNKGHAEDRNSFLGSRMVFEVLCIRMTEYKYLRCEQTRYQNSNLVSSKT